jgi:hypothetical protein
MGNDKNIEELPVKMMDVMVDSNGENKIFGSTDEPVSNIEELETVDSFQELSDKINSDDQVEYLDDKPITEDEAAEYLNNNTGSDSLLNDISNNSDINISREGITEILKIANRLIAGEKFNVYRAFPEEVQSMIDKFIRQNVDMTGTDINIINSVRKNVAESLMDEFINDIQLDRAKRDFARDLENIYKESSENISDASLEYIEERNKIYREEANKIEDEEKKSKLLAILDAIDEATNLNSLKEYAKTCKIKSIDIEKASARYYSRFLNKYNKSTNNIYSIDLARQQLAAKLLDDIFTEDEVEAFFIVFCKQVRNYSPEIPTEHAYMYYVLYNCAMLSSNKSKTFLDNVKEVIYNLRVHNKNL